MKIRGRRCSIEQLKKMRDAGMGQPQIARLLNVDPSTVRYWLLKAGLPTRLEPPLVDDTEVERAIGEHAAWARTPIRPPKRGNAVVPGTSE